MFQGNIDDYKKSIVEFLEKKDYNKHRYCEIFAVSTNSPESAEVEHLREVLCKLALDEEYEVPLTWFNLKECIKKTQKAHLTWKEVKTIGKDINLQEVDQMKSALVFLHAVGDLVFFEDLEDYIVPNPQWLISQFGKIITIGKKDDPEHSEYWVELDEHGYLRGSFLEEVWPNADERKHITKLMEKFALLLPVKDYWRVDCDVKQPAVGEAEYLVPCLLPPAEEPKHEEGYTCRPLILKPVCNFIPAGLMARLFSSLCTENKWEICGRLDTKTASFLLQDGSRISLSTNTSSREIEVRGYREDNRTLKGALIAIADMLTNLPGTVEFEARAQCSHGMPRLGKLSELQKIADENRALCYSLGCSKLLDSEYAMWFCDSLKSTGRFPFHNKKSV